MQKECRGQRGQIRDKGDRYGTEGTDTGSAPKKKKNVFVAGGNVFVL